MIPWDSKVPQPVGDSSYGKQKRTKARDQKAEEEEAVVCEPLTPSRPRLGPTGFQESDGSTGVPARAEILFILVSETSGMDRRDSPIAPKVLNIECEDVRNAVDKHSRSQAGIMNLQTPDLIIDDYAPPLVIEGFAIG